MNPCSRALLKLFRPIHCAAIGYFDFPHLRSQINFEADAPTIIPASLTLLIKSQINLASILLDPT